MLNKSTPPTFISNYLPPESKFEFQISEQMFDVSNYFFTFDPEFRLLLRNVAMKSEAKIQIGLNVCANLGICQCLSTLVP